jgi:hypothetical protein
MKLYHDQRYAQVFLFTSALHISGFLLARLQRQVYNFGSGSSLLGMVSVPEAPTPYPADLNHRQNCTPASEDGVKESPKRVRQKKIDNRIKIFCIVLVTIQLDISIALQ